MKIIYDIGSHTGFDTEFYLKKGFDVVAVEANPHLAINIENKFPSECAKGKLNVIKKAISDQEGTIEFITHKIHSDWGTVNPEWNKQYPDEIKKIEVETISLKNIIDLYGTPYYMKIDIEGADAMCIKQLKGLELPKYISAELLTFNNILDKNANCLEVINALLELGYTKFQLVDQSKNHLTKCPNPAKEGKFVDYKFNGYCSGLFGKELPEEWVNIEEILLKYIHYFYRKPNCCGDSLYEGGWFDIHATKL